MLVCACCLNILQVKLSFWPSLKMSLFPLIQLKKARANSILFFKQKQFVIHFCRKRSGRVLDSRPMGCRFLSLTGLTALYPWATHINPCLVLVQPRRTRPDKTENIVDWDVKNQIKQNKLYIFVKKYVLSTWISKRNVINIRFFTIVYNEYTL